MTELDVDPIEYFNAEIMHEMRHSDFEADEDVPDDKPRASREPETDVKPLHAKIGQPALENDFLEGAVDKAGLLPSARK